MLITNCYVPRDHAPVWSSEHNQAHRSVSVLSDVHRYGVGQVRRGLFQHNCICRFVLLWIVSVTGLSLSQTVLISESWSVLKSGLKTFLFTHSFTEHWSDLSPEPLKLRPYGAIEIWLSSSSSWSLSWKYRDTFHTVGKYRWAIKWLILGLQDD